LISAIKVNDIVTILGNWIEFLTLKKREILPIIIRFLLLFKHIFEPCWVTLKHFILLLLKGLFLVCYSELWLLLVRSWENHRFKNGKGIQYIHAFRFWYIEMFCFRVHLSVLWSTHTPWIRRVCVRYRYNTDIYDYIELCHFSNYYRCWRVCIRVL
jgi:hypothetical protein